MAKNSDHQVKQDPKDWDDHEQMPVAPPVVGGQPDISFVRQNTAPVHDDRVARQPMPKIFPPAPYPFLPGMKVEQKGRKPLPHTIKQLAQVRGDCFPPGCRTPENGGRPIDNDPAAWHKLENELRHRRRHYRKATDRLDGYTIMVYARMLAEAGPSLDRPVNLRKIASDLGLDRSRMLRKMVSKLIEEGMVRKRVDRKTGSDEPYLFALWPAYET